MSRKQDQSYPLSNPASNEFRGVEKLIGAENGESRTASDARNDTADAIKAAMIILVVIGHIFTAGVYENQVKTVVYLVHMPIMLAFSGYYLSASRPPAEILARAWLRYLRPWLIASAAYYALLYGLRGGPPFTLAAFILDPWYHLWYVPAILIFTMICLGLGRRWLALVILSAPVIALSCGVNPRIWLGGLHTNFIYYGAYFAIGYAARGFFARIEPAALVPLLGVALGLAAFGWPDFGRGTWLQYATRAALVTGVLAAAAAAPRLPAALSRSVFARESLAIYLWHMIPILLLRRADLDPAAYWACCLLWGLAIVPALVHVWRARQWPAANALLGAPSGGRAATAPGE